jgi:NAD dependent epimerase/dehydratase family
MHAQIRRRERLRSAIYARGEPLETRDFLCIIKQKAESEGYIVAILVTGGAGYIGSVTVEQLRESNEKIVVLDDLARGHRAALDGSVPFYHGRVGDRSLLERITQEHEIDSCIHFAALAYVGESVDKPAIYFENNVEQGGGLDARSFGHGYTPSRLFFNLRHVRGAGTNAHTRANPTVAEESVRLVKAHHGALAG